MLHNDSIQVSFVRPLIGDDTLVIQTLLKEPLVVMLSEDHPLTELDEVPLEDLRNGPFVVVPCSREPDFHDYYISLCHQAGFSPNVVQEAHHSQPGGSEDGRVAGRCGHRKSPETGPGVQAHAVNERVSIEEVYKLARTLARSLMRLRFAEEHGDGTVQ